MDRKKASDFDQELLNLYDKYAHGIIERREFLEKAAKFAIGGLTAASLLDMLSPDYALAKQVDENDPRIKGQRIKYASPKGHGTVNGYLVRPAGGGRRGGVVIVAEAGVANAKPLATEGGGVDFERPFVLAEGCGVVVDR